MLPKKTCEIFVLTFHSLVVPFPVNAFKLGSLVEDIWTNLDANIFFKSCSLCFLP